jgi:hypothetical protein
MRPHCQHQSGFANRLRIAVLRLSECGGNEGYDPWRGERVEVFMADDLHPIADLLVWISSHANSIASR